MVARNLGNIMGMEGGRDFKMMKHYITLDFMSFITPFKSSDRFYKATRQINW